MSKQVFVTHLRSLAALALIFGATAAQAGIIQTSASLDGSQASAGAGTGSAATGSASLTIDTTALTLDLAMTVVGITLADITFAPPSGLAFGGAGPIHIHEAPAGANGPIIVPFPSFTDYASTMTGFTLDVSGASITQANLDAIIAGNAYLNVHTQSFGSGEIRGQISAVPEPGTLLILAAALLGIAVPRRHRAA